MNDIGIDIKRIGADSYTEDLLVECAASTKMMAKVMFPDRFTAIHRFDNSKFMGNSECGCKLFCFGVK